MASSPAIVPVKDHPNDDWRTWWQSQTDDLGAVLESTASFMNDDSKKKCLDIARSARIYERLTVLMFMHQSFHGTLLNFPDAHRTAQATWNSWSEFQLLTNHHIVRDTICQSCQVFSDRCFANPLPVKGIDVQRMIDLDISDIQSKILRALSNQSEKKAFYSSCLDNPIPMLNLLQELLDRNGPSCESNVLLARAMSRLSKRSGCYPDCLILSDVERTGEHPVAGGGFADVWRGNSGGRLVALKALRIYGKPCREATFKEFCHEATIWRQLVHPNILPFYGVFKGDDSFDRLCLVSPWMDAGNVSTYLATHPNADRISLLADVTKGLDYLHFFVTPIVHGDLKGANIFVTSSLTACLGDFGLSHFKDSVDSTSGSTSGHATGTLRWQAPELFQRNCDGQDTRPSRESDSYSFGCVCLELMTDRPPFSEIRTDFAALAAIMEAKTPERPSAEFAHRGLDDSLWAVIEKCWNRDPRLRPTSKDLVAHFNVRINGPPQLLLSDINVQEMGAFCRLREGIMGEKTFQPLAVTHPAGNASTYANGVSAIYQLPVPNRQSAHWLMSFPTSEVDTDLSPILGTPVLKKRKNDGRSDISPPSKRISTGSKLGNVIVTTYSRQSDSNATAEGAGDDKPEDGHYIVIPDDMLSRRYRIVRLLRSGPFGKVVEAVDAVDLTRVAIKIIRAIPRCRNVGKTEIRVLQKLKEHDQDYNKCVHLLNWFEHQNHICLVSELLGTSVYEFLKNNDFQPFPRRHIQDFARQLCESISFLHDLHLVHTDLKPESILLVRNSSRTVNHIVSNKGCSHTHQKRILEDTDIRITDFDNATFEAEYHSTVISTRHYRAPEVIQGLGWSYPSDVFSLGCILVEFYTGVALFQACNNLEHLAMMERVIGRIPERLARYAATSKPEFFREDGRLDWPKTVTSRQGKKIRNLKKLIPPEDAVNQLFLDLLVQLLAYDPAQRISVRDALEHPYFALDIPMEDHRNEREEWKGKEVRRSKL